MSVTAHAVPAWRWANPNLGSNTLQQVQCLEKVRHSLLSTKCISQTNMSKINQTALDLITLLEDFGGVTDPPLGPNFSIGPGREAPFPIRRPEVLHFRTSTNTRPYWGC